MGWKVRYNGGDTKRKRSLSVPAKSLAQPELAFEKGVVYDMRPSVAMGLMGDYPGWFERVYGDDPDYENPQPPPIVLPDPVVEPVPAEPTVTIRALVDAQIPEVPGSTDRTITAGEEVVVHPDIAADLMQRMPGVFEIVTPT